MDSATAGVLDAVDELRLQMFGVVSDVVRIPSGSVGVGENDAQAFMADALASRGFDLDCWRIDLEELRVDPDAARAGRQR